MEFGRTAPEFERLGYKLAALAVDAPERSARVRREWQLPFPILCDTGREAVRAWDLYNRRERGGIAVPATAVVGADGRIQRITREGPGRRLKANGLLAWLADEGSGPAPRRRVIVPGWRAWYHAFRR